ncbi:MAG: UvrD-helicase domain-containing protein, partial [bacterium]
MNSDILEKIIQEHKKDKEQLEVIESNEKRLIVEAPPGYGKTKTMISQIAYILASGKLPNPKKILVLTFSVNAAYKIKKDILDLYKEHAIEYHKLNRSIFITNYHGFCRRFLNLYGYLISESLRDINKFKTFDDNNTDRLTSIEGITDEMARFVDEFNKKIKEAKEEFIKSIEEYNKNEKVIKLIEEYNEIVLKYIQNQLPFNAILTLTIEILKEKEKLKRFFHALYPIIMVDEFQDTNFLSLFLLCLLVGENTSLYLYGDPLQRIYGFIGAIPNLMERSMEHFKIEKKIEFKTNYRFRENKYMLDLEKTLRTAARNFKESKSINVEIYLAPNQQQEANYICELVKNLLKEQEAKIAVLVRKRDGNTNEIVNALKSQNIDFFYALYSEEDEDYKKFHEKILEIFEKELEKENYKLQKLMLNNIKRSYEITSHREEYLSLLELFELFWKEGVFGEYNFLETQ